MRKRTKALVAMSTLTAVAVGGAAYAYWTSNGSGTTTGTIATVQNTDIVLDGTFNGPLFLGGTATLSVTVANNASSPVRIGPVSAAVTVLDGSNTDINNVCQISASTYNQNTDVPANQAATALADLTVTMVDDPNVDQEACKSATITFTLSSTTPV